LRSSKRLNFIVLDKSRLIELLHPIYKKYNCNEEYSFLENKLIIKFKSSFEQIEIIENNSKVREVLDELEKIGLFPYSVGEPIILKKGKDVRPLIPLAKYLSQVCKNKLILKSKLAEKITYGKTVRLSLGSLKIKEGSYLVYNEKNDFICYSNVKIDKKGIKIIPELDIGWYLRKGG